MEVEVDEPIEVMGVARAMAAATRLGYAEGAADWSNLGQGAPDVGALPGAPARLTTVELDPRDHAYGPLAGVDALRAAVARLYNARYRCDRASRYTAANVAITAGGRGGLARALASLGDARVGMFSPDYASYANLLTHLGGAAPCPLDLDAASGFVLTAQMRAHVAAHELSHVLISNPGNPTGRVIHGAELAAVAAVSRATGCALLVDEFYSHYVFPGARPVSIAEHVEDVEDDPIVVFGGLTKDFRYPGWRIGWVVGPEALVARFAAAGAFLDGGAARHLQQAALALLAPAAADAEAAAIRAAFGSKRDLVVDALDELGFALPLRPDGAFYAFAGVAGLPAGLDTGPAFFAAALGRGVITVPGEYFDVGAPDGRPRRSPYADFVRISFGAPEPEVRRGLDRLRALVRAHGG